MGLRAQAPATTRVCSQARPQLVRLAGRLGLQSSPCARCAPTAGRWRASQQARLYPGHRDPALVTFGLRTNVGVERAAEGSPRPAQSTVCNSQGQLTDWPGGGMADQCSPRGRARTSSTLSWSASVTVRRTVARDRVPPAQVPPLVRACSRPGLAAGLGRQLRLRATPRGHPVWDGRQEGGLRRQPQLRPLQPRQGVVVGDVQGFQRSHRRRAEAEAGSALRAELGPRRCT